MDEQQWNVSTEIPDVTDWLEEDPEQELEVE